MNIRGLMQSAAFIMYTKKIKERLDSTRLALEIEKDPIEINRKQGEISALRYVLEAPELLEEEARLEKSDEANLDNDEEDGF